MSREASPRAPLSVLLVEDDPVQREYALFLVRSLGYEVRTAADGREALDLLEREPAHIVLTDLVLPDLDGLQLCQEVRSRPLGRTCYLILCTGSSLPGRTKTPALRAGADAFLNKPLDPDEVAAQFHVASRIVGLRLESQAHLEAQEAANRRLERELRRRRRAEARGREEKQRFQAVLEYALDPIVMADHHGRLVEFNPAAEALFGYRRAEILGRPLADTIIPERFREAHERGLERFLGTREHRILGRRLELDARRADGSEFPVEIVITAREHAGKPVFTAYLEDLTERRRIEAEVRAAREREVDVASGVQRTLLFGVPPVRQPGLEVAALTLPSQKVGGDFYDFLLPTGTSLDLVLGDVMGKGVPAALLGAATKAHLQRVLTRLSAERRGPAHPLAEPRRIVDLLHSAMSPELIRLGAFLTLQYARIDLLSRTLTLVGAGHPPALLVRSGGVLLLEGTNVPLGFLARERYEQESVALQEGDLLVLYSDGVIEAGSAGTPLGCEGLNRLVHAQRNRPLEGILQACVTAARELSRADALDDDLTMLAVRVTGFREEPCLAHRELEAWADLADLPRIRAFLEDVLEDHAPQVDEMWRMQLLVAVNEAASNAIRHASDGAPHRRLRWAVDVEPRRLVVRMEHEGSPVEAHRLEGARIPEEPQEGGMGLGLIRECTDSVQLFPVTEGGGLEMSKDFPGSGAG